MSGYAHPKLGVSELKRVDHCYECGHVENHPRHRLPSSKCPGYPACAPSHHEFVMMSPIMGTSEIKDPGWPLGLKVSVLSLAVSGVAVAMAVWGLLR